MLLETSDAPLESFPLLLQPKSQELSPRGAFAVNTAVSMVTAVATRAPLKLIRCQR